jgi:hypothetical protein
MTGACPATGVKDADRHRAAAGYLLRANASAPRLVIDSEQLVEELGHKLGVEGQLSPRKRVGPLGGVLPAGSRDGDKAARAQHAARLHKGAGRIGQVVEDVQEGDRAERRLRERKRGGLGLHRRSGSPREQRTCTRLIPWSAVESARALRSDD